MPSSDTQTERVQLTLPRSLVTQCREIAEQSGLTLSKVVEHFARSGVQQGLTLTFSPSSRSVSAVSVGEDGRHSSPTHQRDTLTHGSKPTTARNQPGEIDLKELFVDPPKPSGAPADDLEDATDAAVPLHR